MNKPKGERFVDEISSIDLLERFIRGEKVSDIASEYNVSREAVYQRLRKNEQWRHLKAHTFELRDRQRIKAIQVYETQIVDGWLSGVSMQDLAREFDTNRSMISLIIRFNQGTAKRNHRRDRTIVTKYDSGVTQRELSSEYGISQPCISRIINSMKDVEEGEIQD